MNTSKSKGSVLIANVLWTFSLILVAWMTYVYAHYKGVEASLNAMIEQKYARRVVGNDGSSTVEWLVIPEKAEYRAREASK